MNADVIKPKNRWKPAFLVSFAILLFSNAFWVYGYVDRSVTISYMREGMRSAEEDLISLKNLLPTVMQSQSKADILALLRRTNPKAFIVDTDSTISIGQLVFHFDRNSALRAITTL
jgi:hypothetical protein